MNFTEEALGFLPTLSYDALLDVLSFLEVKDLGRLAQVSRCAKELAQDDVVWRRLCRELEGEWAKLLSLSASIALSSSSTQPAPSSNPAPITTTTPSPAPAPTLPSKPVPSVLIQCSPSSDWRNTYHYERNRVNSTTKFVGAWNEKWCDVDVESSTIIESDGSTFIVTYKKNKFTASFRAFDPKTETLTFHLEGGDSGWAFLYHLTPTSDSVLQLKVLRLHDKKSFNGNFIRQK